MNIVWHGHSLFSVAATPKKNSQVRIVIDPYDRETGLRVPKLEADVVLVTHDHHDHNNVKAVSGDPFLIEGPGEYDVKDVFIRGISSFHGDKQGKERRSNTIYTIEAEEIRICHLGDLGQKELSEEQVDKIGNVDILMIPVGGTYTISGQEAVKIISQIEPSISIPMHYALPGLKIKLDSVNNFLKALGLKSMPAVKKLSLKKKDINPEEPKIIVMEK